MPIFYVDAPAGAGKTYALAKLAAERASGDEKYLIIQPTVALIRQTEELLREIGFKGLLRAIHNENSLFPTKDITNHIRTTIADGEILLITHSAFERLPYFHRRKDWNIIFDEIPEVVHLHDHTLAESHGIITQHLASVPVGGDSPYSLLEVGDKSAIDRMAANINNDDLLKMLQRLTRDLRSEHWTTYCHTESYEKLLTGKGKKLIAFSMRNPSELSGFRSVTIACARFKETIFYQLWRLRGVEFEEKQLPPGSLRYDRHNNGHLITVRSFIAKNWSKNLRDKPGVLDAYVNAIKEVMSGAAFLHLANKDQADLLAGVPGSTLMPFSPHGLNNLQHVHNTVITAAINPAPVLAAFLKHQGLTDQQIRTAYFGHTSYQAIMRSSIRNPNDPNAKLIAVPDHTTARWLADEVFWGARHEISEIDFGDAIPRASGRPKKYANAAEKAKAYRERQKAKKAPEGAGEVPVKEVASSERNEITNSSGSIVTVSLYGSVRDPEAVGPVRTLDLDDFITFLKEAQQRKIKSKAENKLVSTTVFDASLSTNTTRGLDNVVSVSGIWLDNDGGDLTHQQFADLFSELRMWVFNTFSHTDQNPRWRVFIPTSRSMTAEEYRILFLAIIERLKAAGYPLEKSDPTKPYSKAHGFDVKKGVATSLYYLPCLPATGPGFFIEYRDVLRGSLAVDEWMEAFDIEPVIGELQKASQESMEGAWDTQRVEAALTRWRGNGGAPGAGNREFFRLAIGLYRAGLSPREIEAKLAEESAYANTPADR